MKYTRIFVLLMGAMLALSACQKDDHNGDLYGQWQLLTKTSVAPGSEGRVEDQKSNRIYWSFQLHLAKISGVGPTVLTRFNHHGDSLTITQVYQNIGTHDTLLAPAAVSRLEPAGLTRVPTAFKVEHLNSKQMTLCSDEYHLTFRKF